LITHSPEIITIIRLPPTCVRFQLSKDYLPAVLSSNPYILKQPPSHFKTHVFLLITHDYKLKHSTYRISQSIVLFNYH